VAHPEPKMRFPAAIIVRENLILKKSVDKKTFSFLRGLNQGFSTDKVWVPCSERAPAKRFSEILMQVSPSNKKKTDFVKISVSLAAVSLLATTFDT
jgi:hypothetical protein